MLTSQEIFEKVVRHLIKQGKRARLSGEVSKMCMYRTPNKLKCAAGVLITDEVYRQYDHKGNIDIDGDDDTNTDNSLEGKNANQAPVTEALIKSGVDMTDEATSNLVLSLQKVHDQVNPTFWSEKLRDVGKNHRLDVSFIDDLVNNAVDP